MPVILWLVTAIVRRFFKPESHIAVNSPSTTANKAGFTKNRCSLHVFGASWVKPRIAVYPLPDTNTFNIRAFEIDRYILDQGYDIGEADLLNFQMVVAVPEDQIESQLREWISAMQQLVVPWQCDRYKTSVL